MKLKLTLFTLFAVVVNLTANADSFCGVVLADNGLNIRTEPSLKSSVIYKLYKGETFILYSDGYTEIYETIKDGTNDLKGQWVKIDLYSYDENHKTNEGYIFMTPKYATEIYDCREFRHRITENELYNSLYDNNEDGVLKKDSLKSLFKLEYKIAQQDYKAVKQEDYIKDDKHFKVIKDTIFLNLDNGKTKKIISYPLGKNGNEDYLENYNYIGYSKRLDSYLISGSYWESGDCYLVNKKTGNASPSFLGLPNVSPNKKSIFVAEYNLYEEGTHMSFYKIVGNNFKLIFQYTFGDWNIDDDLFWISNSEVLIPARSIKDQSNWVDDDYNHDNEAKALWKQVSKQYISVKIL